MATTFSGPDATKAQTMQDLYKELTVNKEGNFEVEVTPESFEATRVALLTLLRNGLKALNAQDGKSIVREYYPTPGMPTPFFDEIDLTQLLNDANTLLNPRDPYFAMAVSDGEVGAIRMFGDVVNMVNRYGDARTAFVLLRMFVRPVKEGETTKMITELPFDERRKALIRRRNSILSVGFRADNSFLVPQLMKKYAAEDDQKILTGVVNAYEQNAGRLNLTELQRTRWLFVLLNTLAQWKGEMTPSMREGMTTLVLSFNSAAKPEEIAVKIDAFVETIAPLPAAEAK